MKQIEMIESPLESIPYIGSPERVLKEDGRLVIHPHTAVVQDTEGNVISRYQDDKWETTHYGTYGNMLFEKFGNDKDTVKRLCFVALMSAHEVLKASSANVALAAYTVYTILQLIRTKMDKHTKTLEEALLDKEIMYNAVNTVPNSRMIPIERALRIIGIIGMDVGIRLAEDEELTRLIEDKKKLYEVKQHAAIPFEIYSNLFLQRWAHFERIEKEIKTLVKFTSHFATDTNFGREQVNPKFGRSDESKLIPFEQAIKQYGLTRLFKLYGVNNVKKFQGFITGITVTMSQLISQLTGMRTGELMRLQQGCYKAPDKKRPPIIVGMTSKKYSGIPKPQEWITHYDAERIISLLEQLGSALLVGIKLQRPNERPLFVGSSYADYQKRQIALHYNHKIVPDLRNDELPLDNSKGQLTLTQNMMDNFLKKIDRPERWDNDPRVVVGEQWKPNTHQNRRTFALLAINSGFVSYASLKGQLAQLSMLTAAYYANGATNIAPIITDGGGHITDEIQKQLEEQATQAVCMQLMSGVMNMDKEESEWEKDELRNEVCDPADYIRLHSTTEKEIRKGNIAARSTPTGWCTLVGRCDSFLTFTFINCGDCDHSKPDLVRINRSIEATDSLIFDLTMAGHEKDSIAIRSAEKDKAYFLRMKEKVEKEQHKA